MRILLYYSTIISTLIWISSFLATKTKGTIIGIVLFAPIIIYLWILVISEIKKTKQNN